MEAKDHFISGGGLPQGGLTQLTEISQQFRARIGIAESPASREDQSPTFKDLLKQKMQTFLD